MRPFHSNCLIWALARWQRFGGYFAMRRSYYGPVPHFVWSPDLARWYGFTPINPREDWRIAVHMLCFLGIVRREQPLCARYSPVY